MSVNQTETMRGQQPTPEAVDAACKLYLELQAKADEADSMARQAKSALIEEVQRRGYVPKNAESSRRIDGKLFVATVTSGSTVEVNDANVQQLELLCSKVKKQSIFQLMFERRVEFSFRKGAEEVARAATLPKRYAQQFTELYAKCFTIKGKSPSLKVETRATIEEREAKAAKRAAKKKVA